MRRRDVLRGMTAAFVGSGLGSNRWAGALVEATDTKPALATAVRGLLRHEGQLAQPVRIAVEMAKAGDEVVTRIDGAEVDRRRAAADGPQTFTVYVAPVDAVAERRVEVLVAGVAQAATVELKPVRQMTVYLLPHSHHDLGFTDLQANVEEKQMNNILKGIALAQKTADYPEGARFVWNLEVLWGADLLLKRRPEAERQQMIEAVKKGWLGLNGAYANELTGLCRPEELVELFRFGTELGKRCGVPVRSAMMSDVPGYTWGTVTAMAQAGVRYFSAAPNYFDRIGTFMVEWQDKPMWWVGPSGKDRVLFWVPWTGYAMSHVMKLGDAWVGKYQDRMDEVKFPYAISYARWSGHGDNAEPDPELSEFVREWNTTYEWPKFSIASTETAFRAFEEKYGDQLPEHRGDLTPYWEDGAGSSARETALSRGAAERIVMAGALGAAFAPVAEGAAAMKEAAQYEEAWRQVLLYSEHTWGAWNSVSDSENQMVKEQWAVKQRFALDAAKDAEALLREAVGGGPEGKAGAFAVYNATSWVRTEVVLVGRDKTAAGDRVEDARGRAVPSQRLSSGELAVLVTELAPFSRRDYRVVAGQAQTVRDGVRVRGEVMESAGLRVRLDAATGDLVDMQRAGGANLVDSAKGALNQFLYVAGSDAAHPQPSGKATLTVEDHGPLVATVRVESAAPGCNGLTRRVRMVAGQEVVLLENTVDKKQAPLNPHPGQGGPGDAFAQRGNKESLQFAFPFAVPGGVLRLNVPLAVMRPEVDQLPGSSKNWLPVGRWADVSAAGGEGVTWATLDAPLVEVGEISATMLGSQRNPTVWRKTIEPTQLLYSWVMNNHWGTNYRAYQDGPVVFRYGLRVHGGKEGLAGAARFGTGLSQPLVVGPAGPKGAKEESLLRLSTEEVLVESLRESVDGIAWIVRLFGASGERRGVRLMWSKEARAGQTTLSDLGEEPGRAVEGEVAVEGWELVTLRVERRV